MREEIIIILMPITINKMPLMAMPMVPKTPWTLKNVTISFPEENPAPTTVPIYVAAKSNIEICCFVIPPPHLIFMASGGFKEQLFQILSGACYSKKSKAILFISSGFSTTVQCPQFSTSINFA